MQSWCKPCTNSSSIRASRESRLTPLGRATQLVRSARTRCKKAGHECTLDPKEIADRIFRGRCARTGTPFDLRPPTKTFNNWRAPSLDRIDPDNRDYTQENVQVVCWGYNIAKAEGTDEGLLKLARAIIKTHEEKNHVG